MNETARRSPAMSRARLALGDRVLDLRRGALLDACGAPVDLRAQVWAVLEHLARNAGRVVAKEELLDAVWPGLVVTDGSVMQAISDVRAALGDTEHRIVKTMQRRGYMLIADVLDDDAEATGPVTADATRADDSESARSAASHAMQAMAGPAQGRLESRGEKSSSAAAQVLAFRLRRDDEAPAGPVPGLVEVWPQQRRLRIDGSDAALGGRAFDLLVALLERRERVVNRSELFDLVWPGRVVEDNNLAAQILALRKLLGAGAIATVPGRGYRFMLVAHHEDEPAPQTPAAAPAPSDGTPEPFGLPAVPALFGRDDDLEALEHQLAQHRHVSVLGAGGIGKTVLALAAAHARRAAHRDGAVWVDLSALSQAALVPVAVAQALHLPVGRSEQPIPALVAGMKALDVLLLLDNAEHLVDEVAQFADAIAAGAPGVRLLVTSQVALKIDCERVFRLGPLAVPDAEATAARAIGFGAIGLFVDQAQAVDRRFELSDDNVAAVIDLCRQLDGLALAIKLAAGRIAFFGLRGLGQRLAERLKLLTGNSRSAPTRQQTLRAALDWSYGLLAADEQATFRRLGVFAGGSGFSLELAGMVAGEDNADAWAVIEHMAALVDRSLVAADGAEPPRYRLLESAREYALLKLDETGELQATQQRLARAMLVVFKKYNGWTPTTSDAVLLATYACELDNVRRALDWSVRHDPPLAVELLARAAGLHILLGLHHEYRRRAVVLEAAVADVPKEVAARYWLYRASNSLPQVSTVLECARKAVALYRSIGNEPHQLYLALLWIGWCAPLDEWEAARVEADAIELSGDRATELHAWRRHVESSRHSAAGRFAEARDEAAAGLALARSVNRRRTAAVIENILARTELDLGQVDQAVRRLRALIARERRVLGGILELSYAMLARGLILQGSLDEAREALAELFRQARMTDCERFSNWAYTCPSLAIREQRFEAAARLMGFVAAECRRDGIELAGGREPDSLLAALAERLEAPALERLLAEGAAMDREAAFASTLERTTDARAA